MRRYIPVTPTFREADFGRYEVQGYLQLCSEFVVNLAYVSLCLKTTKL